MARIDLSKCVGFNEEVTEKARKISKEPSFVERMASLSEQVKKTIKDLQTDNITEEDVDKAIDALAWLHYHKDD